MDHVSFGTRLSLWLCGFIPNWLYTRDHESSARCKWTNLAKYVIDDNAKLFLKKYAVLYVSIHSKLFYSYGNLWCLDRYYNYTFTNN